MEEDELRDSEAVEKVIETGGRGMKISEILFLFLLQTSPISIAPLSFSPFVWLSHPLIKESGEAQRQGWDFT